MGTFGNLLAWQNYVHYVLNTLFLFAEVIYFNLYGLNVYLMFLIVFVLLFINDTAIHIFFTLMPDPIYWDD